MNRNSVTRSLGVGILAVALALGVAASTPVVYAECGQQSPGGCKQAQDTPTPEPGFWGEMNDLLAGLLLWAGF